LQAVALAATKLLGSQGMMLNLQAKGQMSAAHLGAKLVLIINFDLAKPVMFLEESLWA
jgi:hypothetical protein